MSTKEPDTGPKGGTKHLSARERRMAIALWERGEVTLDELGKKFKRTPGSFAKFFAKHGIRKGSKSALVKEAIDKKLEEKTVAEVEETQKAIVDAKKETLTLQTMIRKLVGHALVEARKNNENLGSLQATMKTLHAAAVTARISREETYILLGIDPESEIRKNKEDGLPTLEISELTDEQIQTRMFEAQSELGDEDLQGLAELDADDLGDLPNEDEAESEELDQLLEMAEKIKGGAG